MKQEKLESLDKVALFLFSIGEEAASGVLKQMEHEDVTKITQRMTQMNAVSGKIVQEVLKEFSTIISENEGVFFSPGADYAKSVVSKAFGDKKAEKMFQSMSSQDDNEALEVFRNLDPRVLSDFLKAEHPQTIALILSHLYPAEAGEVIAALPENIQIDVISRMSNLNSVPPEIINDVAKVLENEIKAVRTKTKAPDGIKSISEMLNQMDRASSGNLLTRIEENQPELAEKIRENMFVFDNLVDVDDRGIQEVLKEISTDELSRAMKTASEPLKEKIFNNMSERAADMLREDIEDMGPTRLADIEKAQLGIVKVVMKLAEEGRIILGTGDEDVLV
jgi:flagellar motor switch protein FliG